MTLVDVGRVPCRERLQFCIDSVDNRIKRLLFLEETAARDDVVGFPQKGQIAQPIFIDIVIGIGVLRLPCPEQVVLRIVQQDMFNLQILVRSQTGRAFFIAEGQVHMLSQGNSYTAGRRAHGHGPVGHRTRLRRDVITGCCPAMPSSGPESSTAHSPRCDC